MPSKSLKDESSHDRLTFETFIDVSSCSFEIPDFVQLQDCYAPKNEVSQIRQGYQIPTSFSRNNLALPLNTVSYNTVRNANSKKNCIQKSNTPAHYKAQSQKKQAQTKNNVTLFTKSVLGEGGFGKVLKARLNGKPIAVKLFSRRSDWIDEKTIHEKFTKTRNVLKFIKASEKDGKYYILMERGSYSLQDYLEKHILTFADKCEILFDILVGVYNVHEKNIVHNDIKPGNIIMVNDTAKIGDFGLSEQLSNSKPTSVSTDGTPGLQAYEVIFPPHEHDTAADKFPLGCTIDYLYSENELALDRSETEIERDEVFVYSQAKLFAHLAKYFMKSDPTDRPDIREAIWMVRPYVDMDLLAELICDIAYAIEKKLVPPRVRAKLECKCVTIFGSANWILPTLSSTLGKVTYEAAKFESLILFLRDVYEVAAKNKGDAVDVREITAFISGKGELSTYTIGRYILTNYPDLVYFLLKWDRKFGVQKRYVCTVDPNKQVL